MATTEVLTFDVGDVTGSHQESLPGDYSNAITLVARVSAVNNNYQPSFDSEKDFVWFAVEDSITGTGWQSIEDTQGSYHHKVPAEKGKRRATFARIVVPFAPHLRLNIWFGNEYGSYWPEKHENLVLNKVTAAVYVRRI